MSVETWYSEENTKKTQILEAAVEMFLEKDFYQVKMEEISERAEVGKGTIYEYFANKEELFKESISYWMNSYMQNFEACLNVSPSSKESLFYAMKIHQEFLQEKGRWIKLLYAERPYNMYEMGNWLIDQRKRLLQSIADTIHRGIRSGEIRPDINVEMACRTFLALNYVVMGGLTVLEGIKPEKADLDSLMSFFWEGVGNNETN